MSLDLEFFTGQWGCYPLQKAVSVSEESFSSLAHGLLKTIPWEARVTVLLLFCHLSGITYFSSGADMFTLYHLFHQTLVLLKEKKKAIEISTCRGSFIAQVYNSSDTSFCKLNLPQISLS